MPRTSKAAGSVALVTGANRGIGQAFVQELAARGARKVYAGVRSPSDVTDEFSELPVEIVPLDVTDLAAVQAAAAACPDVNLLVNNAGLFTNNRLVRTDDPDAARREMEVNYFGVLNMTRAFAPVLGANGGGYIANVLSVAGAFPAPFMGGYSPAKAAALFLSSITRSELAEQGTEVIALIVGSVDTRMAAHVQGRKEDPRDIARAGLTALDRGEYVASCPLAAGAPGSPPSTCTPPTAKMASAQRANCATRSSASSDTSAREGAARC
ncbi:MAG TPA: SDR family NAD(P)-dependent oxidoreductase [Streptosporangiaceae bacterium]|nr:SDR family NAD(P)-dependent oxidoreductase [Streptosporangiaceae bacterium]